MERLEAVVEDEKDTYLSRRHCKFDVLSLSTGILPNQDEDLPDTVNQEDRGAHGRMSGQRRDNGKLHRVVNNWLDNS